MNLNARQIIKQVTRRIYKISIYKSTFLLFNYIKIKVIL